MRLLISFLAFTLLAACSPNSNPNAGAPMRVAVQVELSAYQGLWYEIASIPSIFQAGCTSTAARYTPSGDNRVEVLNRCRLGGSTNAISGFATAQSTDSALLAVNLKVAGLFSTGSAPYWVLAVGPKGADGLYDWAVVGNPSRSFGWILARTTTLPAATLAQAEGVLENAGYDLRDFRYDPQDRPYLE